MTNKKDNHFVFICPIYNASKTLPRLLHSLYGQSYDNWKIVLIDDMSSYEDRLACSNIVTRFKNLQEGCKHMHFHFNLEKKWEMENVLWGIKNHTSDDDIICRIDGDDYLTDMDALYIINEYYNATNCEVAWTMHRWGFSDKNISGPMPNDVDPYKFQWVTSHLKTFRKYLLNDVKDENFRNQNGDYIKRCGDQSLLLPCLAKTNRRLFIPRVVYHYTIDDVPETYQTDDAKFQKEEADFIRTRGFIK